MSNRILNRMKEIKGINIQRMNNGAHYSFVNNILTRAADNAAALTRVESRRGSGARHSLGVYGKRDEDLVRLQTSSPKIANLGVPLRKTGQSTLLPKTVGSPKPKYRYS